MSKEDLKIISRKEAIEKGLKRYFTGKPCKHGHVAERNTGTTKCLECRVEKYKLLDKTKLRNIRRNHYLNNREEIIDRSRDYYYKTTTVEIRKERYEKNRDKQLAIKRMYYEINSKIIKTKRKEYYRRNSSYYKLKSLERKELVRIRTPVWADNTKILEIYRQKDIINKETGLVHHVDHIIPLRGKYVCGLHVENNLRIILGIDNLKKRNNV